MKRPRQVEIDWPSLKRAFERFDPTWEGEPLPYLNLRTGKVAYFGEEDGVDLADTLDFDRHVALHMPQQFLLDRHARMRAFVATVAEAQLSERLREALSRDGGVTQFYQILESYPQCATRWQRVEAPRTVDQIHEWLEAEQLLPTNRPTWAI